MDLFAGIYQKTIVEQILMMPGLAPAGEVLLFRQKGPKPLTLSSGDEEGTDARWRANQLAGLKQGS